MFLSAVSSLVNIGAVVIAAAQSPMHFLSSVSQSVTHFLGRTVAEVRIKLFLTLTDRARLDPISFWKWKHKGYTVKHSRNRQKKSSFAFVALVVCSSLFPADS